MRCDIVTAVPIHDAQHDDDDAQPPLSVTDG